MKNGIICFALLFALSAVHAADMIGNNTPSAMPWNEIGVKAGADYKGDGLAVTPTGSGARLRCVFQRLDGEATPEGLWLTSTVANAVSDRFRVTARQVGRKGTESNIRLDDKGVVSVCGQTVRFSRPGLTEEYSLSMDGVRQDFIVEQSPPNPPPGELVVTLAVTSAQVEPAPDGARLALENSGRIIAYNRLRVTDATGKELPARIEVRSGRDDETGLGFLTDTDSLLEEPSLLSPAATDLKLAVVVNDAQAVYPVRIDPTFSDANWGGMGGLPGVNGVVYATVADGLGNVYIGGTFTTVGNAIATNVAEWNGSSWSALGSGLGSDENRVDALAVMGGTLYAGGFFDVPGGGEANYIAQWNGSSWSQLGDGTDGEVRTLMVSGGILYVGGSFDVVYDGPSPIYVDYIAQWNGSGWSGLGSGMNGVVYALAVSGSTLYAGGEFTQAGSATVSCIAQWNGGSWSGLGLGVSAAPPPYVTVVSALAVSGSTLYVGGNFTVSGSSAANCIAQWNGSIWSPLGLGMAGGDQYGPKVLALSASGSTLYAGGDFTTADGNSANCIARWNGSSWSPLGAGIGGVNISYGGGTIVYALAVSGGTLYAGGDFTTVANVTSTSIASWNGSSWVAPPSGLSDTVAALAVLGNTVYAGGNFTAANGVAANDIAQWNGSSWSAVGTGMNDTVLALAVSGSTLYAGGDFTMAGGSAANYIAKWNGRSWSALGLGFGGEAPYTSVAALVVSGGTLYAGGTFTTADGNAANGIAQWNGTSWSPLGSGVNGDVYALAASGSTLYAGGQFFVAGSSSVSCIAQWNDGSWSTLGSGLNEEVYALAASGSTLYAGGQFSDADGNPASYIAQWNGSSWSALGLGMNAYVSALAVSGSTVYAGGVFTTAGGATASDIAQWNGSSWSPLGSGMNSGVYALAVSGTGLYAGGNFTTAGGKVSAYAAMATLSISVVSTSIDNDQLTICWTSVPGVDYNVYTTSSLNAPQAWTQVNSGPIPAATGQTTCYTLPQIISDQHQLFVTVAQEN